MGNLLQDKPMLAYGLMALLVVLIVVVIYYYYSMSGKEDKDSGDEAESYTAGVPPNKPFPEMMTASYIPDSRSDREYMNGANVRRTLRSYGLPTTQEAYASNPGAPLPYSTENALYRNLHAAAARAESARM